MITEPARKIPRRYNGVSGDFPSLKNGGRFIPFESLLERNYMLLLEFDETVASYVEQPIKIPYVNPNSKGRRRSHYTPDVIVYFLEGCHRRIPAPHLVEVKPAKDLEKYRDEFAPKFAAAETLAELHGWCFIKVTEREINGPVLENANVLYQFLPNPADPVTESAVLDFVRWNGGEVTGREIFAKFAPDLTLFNSFPSVLWRMVAHKVLRTDWNQKINLDSRFSA